jgi:hypothetical protein
MRFNAGVSAAVRGSFFRAWSVKFAKSTLRRHKALSFLLRTGDYRRCEEAVFRAPLGGGYRVLARKNLFCCFFREEDDEDEEDLAISLFL